MKVLFAVGSDQLSKNIADKYYEKYGEVLEYKNVFFYKALIDEVKNNKTYDRIVINEEFEEFRTKDLEQLDRLIFNYIDKITDEIQDAEIILISANRRSKGDSFVNKLFSIGIYNLLIGDDRNINPLCDIIKKPKTKREAKQYLNIDTSLITDSSITKDNEVDEYQVKSIINFYEGIKNQPDKYIETFDRVAEQYSRVQLKIIVEYLPKAVKDEIFKVDRYKYLMPQNDVPQLGNSVQQVQQQNKTETQKKRGLFGSLKKQKVDAWPKSGPLDMAQMQPGGRVDLSSNTEEQKRAAIEAEARRRAEAERAKKAQEEALLAQQAKVRDLEKQQIELEAKARAEAEARRQEELAAKAKAEVEAKKQAELEAKARAEAAAREQAMLAEKAKAEAVAREQAMLAEKAKAEANAKEQAMLAARARAEAMARQQADIAAKAKIEANARNNAGFVSNVAGGVDIPKSPNGLVEIKPNPNAPDRKLQKNEIPTAQVVQTGAPKVELNQNDAQKIVTPIGQNINVNPTPVKTVVPQQKPVAPVTPPEKPGTPAVQSPVGPAQASNVQPQIKITTNSGAVPTNGILNNNIRPDMKNNIMSEQEKRMKEEQEKLVAEQRKIREAQERLEEEKRKLREEQEKFVSAQNQLRNEYSNLTPQYTNTTMSIQTAPIPNYKKMIVFVGANKVGTTFVANAVAHSVASAKITTSMIDMTRDKSLYYIYADESKTLKNRAAECMQRLADGEDFYIETMNSYLKLYTSVAGAVSDQRRGYKHRSIIDTVKKNCNLTIVDADFTTPIDYFDQADEIYLVQDLDVLKIQDVTLFLREINARGLDKKKIKLIINKFVKTSITPKIIIGALDFYHDPAGTYVDSGLMPSKVDYSIIPYNLNNYAKYVESLHKMSGNFNYKNYSTDFIQAIDEIVSKIYPKNLATKKKMFG